MHFSVRIKYICTRCESIQKSTPKYCFSNVLTNKCYIFRQYTYIFLPACQEPPEVPYTSIQVETLQNTSIVQYHCNDSLNLIGDGKIYCQNSTAWTTPSFICSSKFYYIFYIITDKNIQKQHAIMIMVPKVVCEYQGNNRDQMFF